MDRGIQKVRQSIKRRKNQKRYSDHYEKNMLPLVMTDEEKHGFEQPVYHLQSSSYSKSKRIPISRYHLFVKAVIAIGLFVFCGFLFNTNEPRLERVEHFMYSALQEEFPFAQVNEWYISTFGSPLSFTPQGSIRLGDDSEEVITPVMGHVVETFATNGTGIMISPQAKTNVTAVNRGIVIFAGNDQTTGKTVIIQHADGSETTYGLLSSIDVHLYQIVEANQPIGTFQPTEENEVVYFAIEKNNKYIDPTQVIPVGDIP